MWVKSNDIVTHKMPISSGQEFGHNERLYIMIANSTWDLGIQSSAQNGSGLVSVTTDWTFLTLVMDMGLATLYVDTVLSKSKTYTSYSIVRDIHLGNHDNNYNFDGNIDSVKIYNRSLTLAEVKNNFIAQKRRFNL